MSHASDDQLEWTFWTIFWSCLILNLTKWKARYAARPIWRFTITNCILEADEGIFGQTFAHGNRNSVIGGASAINSANKAAAECSAM
jgi:hypothetical protein